MDKTYKILAGLCLLFLFYAFATKAAATITEQEAIDISSQSELVQNLLKTHPDAKPTVSLRKYQNKSIFDVFWWTKETTERFHHPDVLVSVDAETGEILFEGTVKGSMEGHTWAEEPTWVEADKISNTGIFIIIGVVIVVILILVLRRYSR